MRVGIVGIGAVGRRTASLLSEDPDVSSIRLFSRNTRVVRQVRAELGPLCAEAITAEARTPLSTLNLGRALPSSEALRANDLDVLISCVPDDEQLAMAETAIAAGVHVVALADSRECIRSLVDLDGSARAAGVAVVAGAAVSPGLGVLLAAHASALFDVVESVAIGVTGTGGPECVSRRTRALKAESMEWRGGEWVHYVGSPGSELLWFPDPIGSIDCGRGDFSETMLLRRRFPDAENLSVKAASPQRVGRKRGPRGVATLASVRVEVQGVMMSDDAGSPDGGAGRSGASRAEAATVVYGVVGPTDLCSAVLAIAAARAIVAQPGVAGAGALADFVSPRAALGALSARGVHPLAYDGTP